MRFVATHVGFRLGTCAPSWGLTKELLMTMDSSARRHLSAATPPQPEANWALFLDLDGTLLDIAPAPDRVVVPGDLVNDLAAASVALGGAVAIVSGRRLNE